jgi:hypothetical protein
MFNYAGFFAQYFEQMPEANQFNDIAELSLTETSDAIGRSYRNLYAGALQDLEDIKGKTTNKADLFAATAMRAFCFQLMVDKVRVRMGINEFKEITNDEDSDLN